MPTLHRAGADTVLSYASNGATAVMNVLQHGKVLMLAEGLGLFEVPVPGELAGQTIAESSIRERTGCSVVAIRTTRGIEVVPSPAASLPLGAGIVLIGTADAEARFLGIYDRSTNVST